MKIDKTLIVFFVALLCAGNVSRALPFGIEEYDAQFTAVSLDNAQRAWYSTFIPIEQAEKMEEQGRKLNYRISPEQTGSYAWVNRKFRAYVQTPNKGIIYKGPKEIELYNSPPESKIVEDENGEITITTKPSPIGTAKLRQNNENWLLLLKNKSKSNDDLQVLMIYDNIEDNPAGSMQFMNITDRNVLYVSVDGKAKKVSRGNKIGFMPGAGKGDQFNIRIGDPGTSTDKPIYANQWYHEDDKRFFILISESHRYEGKISLKVISQ